MSEDNGQVVRDKKEKAESIPLLFDDHELSEQMAHELIRKHHHDLAEAKFKFLCRNKSSKSGERKSPGNIKKASPMEKHLCGGECDYIMIVSLETWNDYTPSQRMAFIDHLLTRCHVSHDKITGKPKFGLRPPQVQEFPEIVERHGAWNSDIQEFNRCNTPKAV